MSLNGNLKTFYLNSILQLISDDQKTGVLIVKNAENVTISGVQTKIFSIEYLVAIMLQLNRPKDRAKIDLLVNNEEVSIDMLKMQQILTKYGLTKKWERCKDVE